MCLYSKKLLQTYTFHLPTSGNAVRLHEAFSSSREGCKKLTHRNPHKTNKKMSTNKNNKVFQVFKKTKKRKQKTPEKKSPKALNKSTGRLSL